MKIYPFLNHQMLIHLRLRLLRNRIDQAREFQLSILKINLRLKKATWWLINLPLASMKLQKLAMLKNSRSMRDTLSKRTSTGNTHTMASTTTNATIWSTVMITMSLRHLTLWSHLKADPYTIQLYTSMTTKTIPPNSTRLNTTATITSCLKI